MTAPRLLDKKVVATEVASQRKQLIDQGLNLARKVDALRETKVEEEGNLEKFRSETIGIVKKEIDSYIAQRETLKKEITLQEETLKLLKLPLDDDWEKIKQSYLKYHESVEALESAKETVARQLGENTMKAHGLETERKKLVELKQVTEENYGNSKLLLSESKEEVAKQRNLAQTVLASAELREKIVIQREQEFRRDAQKETLRLKAWEIALNKRDQEKIVQELIKHSPISKL